MLSVRTVDGFRIDNFPRNLSRTVDSCADDLCQNDDDGEPIPLMHEQATKKNVTDLISGKLNWQKRYIETLTGLTPTSLISDQARREHFVSTLLEFCEEYKKGKVFSPRIVELFEYLDVDFDKARARVLIDANKVAILMSKNTLFLTEDLRLGISMFAPIAYLVCLVKKDTHLYASLVHELWKQADTLCYDLPDKTLFLKRMDEMYYNYHSQQKLLWFLQDYAF